MHTTKQDLGLQRKSPTISACPAAWLVMSNSYVRPLRSVSSRTNTGATTTESTPFTPMASAGCKHSIGCSSSCAKVT
jgi:hypothetical protein